MNKRNKQFSLLLLTLIAGASGFFIFRYVYRKPDAATFINKVREENIAGLDSLKRAIAYENDLNLRIEKSIHNGDFNTAYYLMDSLPAFGKANSLHLYSGMIYEKQKKYQEAIKEYSTLISNEPFPLALSKRAGIYVVMNKLDSALSDYKKAAAINYDYSLQVGTVFNLMYKKDSALKYYNIYLEHYPNDTAVQHKIKNC
ncbi:hypothetical protein A4D02_18190 [Niastella koreensis]|uniref:Tetratricopeptide TPR_1 repeat-containing protein n=2 Tax=Niastella koreensis TaxID=354356 RepID=G8TAB0_NIAKG|nr:tetratricopeptide repeat protein [Niastella koreensis]AEV97057.1 hypothetical protein Niako_0673 [Niastella koreensis GR20-10]OQP39253.1 hypothetical protein A4D02_18190 [Niastella koreensis]